MMPTCQRGISLKAAVDRRERMRVNMIRKFLPAIVARQRPKLTQIISHKLRCVQQFFRELLFRVLLLMFVECPEPCAKPIQLEVGPIARLAVRSIETITCMQDLCLGKLFPRSCFSKTPTH